MNANNENQLQNDQKFFCTFPREAYLEGQHSFVSSIIHILCNIIGLFLTPFYCIGLTIKLILKLFLKLLKTPLRLLIFWKFLDNKEINQTIPAAVQNLRTHNENEHKIIENKEPHSKLIACPNCEHLHYSTRYCKCIRCLKNNPRLLECFKYHKTEARVFTCPCIDCNYKRPMSETCEHCVLVSQKIHIQAKTQEDIEIRTRPKRRK